MDEKITLCLTAGGRPDLLRRTLASLLPYNGKFFSDIIISNDRGDDETTAVARELCPTATIFSHNPPLGQMRSVDKMYAAVTTPLIFHCEDDWAFEPVVFMPSAIELLAAAGPRTSAVAVRQSGCQWRTAPGVERRVPHPAAPHIGVRYPDPAHGGFTFNPTLLRRSFWEAIGPYEKLHRALAVEIRALELGYNLAFLAPGVCYHIGENRHMVDKAQETASLPRKLWRKLRRKATAFIQTK